jgi:hypothetical protein
MENPPTQTSVDMKSCDMQHMAASFRNECDGQCTVHVKVAHTHARARARAHTHTHIAVPQLAISCRVASIVRVYPLTVAHLNNTPVQSDLNILMTIWEESEFVISWKGAL